MKTSRVYLPITVSALVAVLALAASTATGQSSDFNSALKKRAYAVSPRAIEVFPWLTRTSVQPTVATGVSVPAAVTRNKAFAASPRALELFPQLGLPVPVLTKAATTATPEVKNTAYAASPRAKEQFPWLTRKDSVRTFEIAPLK